MESLERPQGSWYVLGQDKITDSFHEGLCDTCRQFYFEWLLSNDLILSRSNGQRGATPQKSDLSLPLGTVTAVLKISSEYLFCDLIIRSFRGAFAVETLFHEAENAAPIVNNPVRVRYEHEIFGNTRVKANPDDPGAIIIVNQNRTPSLNEIDPSEAWLELENRPITWGDFVIPGAPYGIRIWLCTAFKGRPVKNLLFHRIVSCPGELQGCLMSS